MATRTVVLACSIALSPLSALGQTLPEIARTLGGSATNGMDIDAPISRPADLMSRADLVVNGRVTSATTRLNADQSYVMTDYTIAPIQVFKQKRLDTVSTPGMVSTIVVQRTGGSLTTADGLHLSTDVNIYPESETFREGEEVVLFLIYYADTKMYTFATGEFGVYRIRNGMATLMTASAAKRRGDQPIASSALFAELQHKQ
jgi:hypothetical protein